MYRCINTAFKCREMDRKPVGSDGGIGDGVVKI